MVKKVDKIQDLSYDKVIALEVIITHNDLFDIFLELSEVELSKEMLRKLCRENMLNKNTEGKIKQIFEKVILTKQSFIKDYIKLSDITERKTVDDKLPKWYGKDKIILDIANQKGKATNAQLTALELNDLKNVYANLNKRLINDMLTDSPIFTDEEYRTIRSSIQLIKNKLKPLLKK